jgi:hypothetical protein
MRALMIALMTLLIAGCATPIMKKQLACEDQFSKFSELVNCTKESFMADPLARTKDPKVKLYFLKADLLVEQVKTGQISELEARTEWQNLFVELGGKATAESAAAAARYNATRVRQTNCVPVGNTMQCTTY